MGKWAAKSATQESKDKFQVMMELWDAWQNDKSDSLARLQFRINAMYADFSALERVQFTEWMISHGRLNEPIIRAIRLMGGTLERLT